MKGVYFGLKTQFFCIFWTLDQPSRNGFTLREKNKTKKWCVKRIGAYEGVDWHENLDGKGF